MPPQISISAGVPHALDKANRSITVVQQFLEDFFRWCYGSRGPGGDKRSLMADIDEKLLNLQFICRENSASFQVRGVFLSDNREGSCAFA